MKDGLHAARMRKIIMSFEMAGSFYAPAIVKVVLTGCKCVCKCPEHTRCGARLLAGPAARSRPLSRPLQTRRQPSPKRGVIAWSFFHENKTKQGAPLEGKRDPHP